MKSILTKIVYLILGLLLIACGDDRDMSYEDSNNGSISFSIFWLGAPTLSDRSKIQSRALDCEAAGTSIVSFEVMDELGGSLAYAEFPCSRHYGRVDGIPAGSNRKLIVSGLNSEGTLLYRGEKLNITIFTNEVTDVGEIIAFPTFFRITGKIIDFDTGDPIADISVKLVDDDNDIITTLITDFDGGYSYEGYLIDLYAIIIDSQDYYIFKLEDIDLINIEDGVLNINKIELKPVPMTAPNIPFFLTPDDETNDIASRISFSTQSFNDRNSNDLHLQTEWQFSVGKFFLGKDLVFDEKETANLTSFSPGIILNFGRTYYCRAKFIDSSMEDSKWSDTIQFSTEIDSDNDGISDSWEIENSNNNDLSPCGDPDSDNIANRFEYFFSSNPNESDIDIGSDMLLEGKIIDYLSNEVLSTSPRMVSSIGRVPIFINNDGNFILSHPPGVFGFAIVADNYYPIVHSNIEILEGSTQKFDFVMIPMPKNDLYKYQDTCIPEPPVKPNGPSRGSGDGGCFLNSLP
jgi:hypothetical protein